MTESKETEGFEIPDRCSRIEISGLDAELADNPRIIGTLASTLDGVAELQVGDVNSVGFVVNRFSPSEELSAQAKEFLTAMHEQVPGCQIIFS